MERQKTMKNQRLTGILLIALFLAATPLYAPNMPAYKAGVKPAQTFVLRETPRKILIPESTIPANAIFVLLFNNPAAEIVTQAKIFDINGSEVADFTDTTGAGSNPTRLVWDGRDKNGSIVRSGIYIYQVQAGEALVNGTVVVAR